MSDHMKKRGIWLIIPYFLQITGYAILIGTSPSNVNTRYAAVFLAAMGAFPGGPGFLAWGTNNVASQTARAVSSALIVSFGTLGAVVATWTYLPGDAPAFRKGHIINVGAGCLVELLCVVMIFYIKWENRKREQGKRDVRLEKFSTDDEGNAHLGDLHPKFRYIE
jgi:sugar phosphate permease